MNEGHDEFAVRAQPSDQPDPHVPSKQTARLVAFAFAAFILILAALVLLGGRSSTDDEREALISQIVETFGMQRDEVLASADSTCGVVRSSSTLEEFEQFVVAAAPDAAMVLDIAPRFLEPFLIIGRCVDDYESIGGLVGAKADAAERDADRLAAIERAENEPSTPLPELTGGGPASLRLGDGTEFDFLATCTHPTDEQGAGGFRYGVSATTDDGVGLDVTADGFTPEFDDIDPGEVLTISVFDVETRAELWGASSGWGELAFSVEENRITGDGLFYPEGFDGFLADLEGIAGTFTADC